MRRLARRQLRSAIGELTDPDGDRADAIHDSRLRLKKLRSLVRLVRKSAPAVFRGENAALRDVARSLSTQRDRQAIVEALDKLLAHAEHEWDETSGHLPALRELRSRFAESQEYESNGDDGDWLVGHAAEEMRAALERVKEWTAHVHDDGVVVAGFADTYRRARLALDAVLTSTTAENLHEWRKQIKYHRYQTRLFQQAWPAMLEAHCEELKRLSDFLGDDHDLVLLRQALAENDAAQPGDPAFAELSDLIERRRAELQAEAIPLGRLLFAEKPKHLTRRFVHYWCAYRDRGHH